MTIEQFCRIAKDRILTPSEFIDFAESQGWKIVQKEAGPALRAPNGGELATALARMLGREPYRTNVLNEMCRRWREGPRAEPPPDPKAEAKERAVREVDPPDFSEPTGMIDGRIPFVLSTCDVVECHDSATGESECVAFDPAVLDALFDLSAMKKRDKARADARDVKRRPR